MAVEIVHRVHEQGKCQSLAIVIDGKVLGSVGVVLPSNGKFVDPQPAQRIRVLMGELIVNGQIYSPHTGPCVTEEGEQVHIATKEVCLYVCEGD